jgi:Uma2 family endonuclease
MKSGNIRSPDVSFTLKERFPDGRPPKGFGDLAPDLCIEIISPSEDEEDGSRKVEEYFAAGAQQVWHLFRETQQVTVYRSSAEKKIYQADEEIDGGDLLPGFRCRVADLFALD